jgi:hypothetical protein
MGSELSGTIESACCSETESDSSKKTSSFGVATPFFGGRSILKSIARAFDAHTDISIVPTNAEMFACLFRLTAFFIFDPASL